MNPAGLCGARGLARLILERALLGYVEDLDIEVEGLRLEIAGGALRVHGTVADSAVREKVILSLQGIAEGQMVEDHLNVRESPGPRRRKSLC